MPLFCIALNRIECCGEGATKRKKHAPISSHACDFVKYGAHNLGQIP